MIDSAAPKDRAADPVALLAAAGHAFVQAWPDGADETARRRFDAVGPRLRARLHAVYGARADFPAWFTALCAELGRLAAARSAPLQQLDRDREARPNWFISERLVGYTAYADRFAGTLAGVIGRIPHLRDLGVGYLHLLPFLRAREGDSDGGFAVASFEEIEPALGDMDDLERLTAALRASGISLCADFVLNHVADSHTWARAARAGEGDFRQWFHVFEAREDVDALERDLGQVFPEAAPGNFTHSADMGAWVWTTFYPFQWDLNYAHPPVFAAMAQALVNLANRGVEVFRLDSAPYLWKRPGTRCINQPEVHELLAALRAIAELCAPGVLLKAEAITPTAELMPYFGQGPRYGHECHLAYHSSLMATAWASLGEGDAALLRDLLIDLPASPPATGWMSYVRCHDDIVWGVLRADLERSGKDYAARIGRAAAFIEGRATDSFGRGAPFQYADGEPLHGSNGMTASLLGLPDDPTVDVDRAALRRYALMYGLAFWTGAIPLIYMGDEHGQGNNTDPADAARVSGDGRWLQRPRFDERRQAMAVRGEGAPAQVRTVIDALVRARRRLLPVDMAPPGVIAGFDGGLVGMCRGGDALAVFNFGRVARSVDLGALGASGWHDPLQDLAGLCGDAVALPPWGMLWRQRSR